MPAIAEEQMFRLSTDETVACPICGYQTHGGSVVAFGEVCTHILQEHKLKCLHVGQETYRASDGSPFHYTVAIFGR